MKIFLLPTEDATIYQRYPNNNSGLDEILEVGKNVKSVDSANMYSSASSRILMNFNLVPNQYPTSSRYILNLKIANATKINRYQKLEVYLLSGSWTEGSGYFYQDVQNSEDGATWSVKNTVVSWSNSGGDYYANTSASYTLSTVPIQDVKIDVTGLLQPIVSGTNLTPWYGLLIKFPTVDETNNLNI